MHYYKILEHDEILTCLEEYPLLLTWVSMLAFRHVVIFRYGILLSRLIKYKTIIPRLFIMDHMKKNLNRIGPTMLFWWLKINENGEEKQYLIIQNYGKTH